MYWTIPKKQTLKDFLVGQFHGVSQSTLRSWACYERLRVNAQIVKRLDMELHEGDLVERLEPAASVKKPMSQRSKHLGGATIVFEDEHLLILDKPAGLLSVDLDTRGKNNLFSLVKERYGAEKAFVVHRLDRETSGLIAFALNKRAEESLKEQLIDNQMKRRYMAAVCGQLLPCDGTWDFVIEELENLSMRVKIDEKGEPTLSFYQTLETKKIKREDLKAIEELSLIEVELATGKKHQIRVSSAYAGCPLVGDVRYHGPKASRLGLHAYAISLFHPIDGKPCEWISPSTEDFDKWWKRLPLGIAKVYPQKEKKITESKNPKRSNKTHPFKT